jgi:hypothetical protein
MRQTEVLNNKIRCLVKRAKASKNLQNTDLVTLISIPLSMIQKIETNSCCVQVQLLFKTICALKLEEYAIYLTTSHGLKKFMELDL